MLLPTYWFYCGDCEAKTKAVLFFRTFCPCKEAQVVATCTTIEYQGLAISQAQWEQMEKDNEEVAKAVGPIASDFMRRNY